MFSKVSTNSMVKKSQSTDGQRVVMASASRVGRIYFRALAAAAILLPALILAAAVLNCSSVER